MTLGPIQISYAPGGSFNPANLQTLYTSRKTPVSFNVTKAGVTEIVAADGWVTQLTIHVKALFLVGKDEKGNPAYETEFDVIPTVRRLMDDSMRAPGVEAN